MIDIPLLYNKELEARDHSRKKADNKYYMSQAGICIRKRYYEKIDKQPISSRLRSIFHLGKLLHEDIQGIVNSKASVKLEHPLLIEIENKASDDFKHLDLSGRVDILETSSDSPIPYELKTTSNINYVTSPSQHHIIQLNCYLKGLNSSVGYLVYFDKRNGDMKQFPVEFSGNLWQQTKKGIQELHGNYVDRVEPAKPSDIESWQCKYCEYSGRCKQAN